MEDIAPALYEAIQADFDALVADDETIAAILKKIESGTATHAETQQYAIRIGEHAAQALKRNLTEGLLPDGRLYYNIAERTIRPALEHNLELVNAVASQVQAALNEAAGIGIKPISATLDDDRIHRIVSGAADTPTISAMHNWLGEAVVNTTQSFADEFIRANAEFHYESGLSPKIVRTSTGKCCDWCNSLAGTYDYEDARENGVFRRHDYCRCVVDFYTKKGERETVHTGTEGKRKYVRSKASGKYYLTDEADQARKIAHRKEMEATAKEREKAAREKRIATWAKKKEAKQIEERKAFKTESLPEQLAAHPARFASYSPAKLKLELERAGFEVKPLKRGSLRGIPFEEGGGFKVNFDDGGLLQYHPATQSHHGGAYYKISTGKGGIKRYELDGTEKPT